MEMEIEGLIAKIQRLEKELALKEKENKELRNEFKMLNLAVTDIQQ